MCIVAWLSQNNKAGEENSTCNSENKWENHMISQVAEVIALYSASANDRETVFCFLDF